MTARTNPEVTPKALVALGAERLAEILNEIARDDPSQRRRLEDAIRQFRPVKAAHARAMLGSIERRIAALEEMDGYRDWRGAASVGADMDTLRQDIVESVLPVDPEAAANRLEQLVDLGDLLFETADDSDGEISGALRVVVEDWGRAWARVVNRDCDEVAEVVFDAFTEDEYGVLDEAIPAFAEALGANGLTALEARFRSVLDKDTDPNDSDEEDDDSEEGDADWQVEWRRRTMFRGLQEIADVRGDVDSFIAVHKEAGTEPGYAVEIAERLHRAGRSEEALRWLELPNRRRGVAENVIHLHVAILDALGRGADASALLWQAFEQTLSSEHYHGYLQKTPEREWEAVRCRAIEHAVAFDNAHRALEFLVEVDAFAEAAALVLRRKADLHGHAYWTLRPVAEALAADHPMAAVLVYRLLTEAVLRAGKSQSYKYAVADLREAALLAECVDDWQGMEPHEIYMDRLRAEHGRKWSFWKQR
jgi:hypothetical protein